MQLVLDLRSHSHRFTEGCFAFFEQNSTGFGITQTSDTTFSLAVDSTPFENLGSKNVLYHCHLSASNFLIALNMASLGYFCWDASPSLHPMYRVRRPPSSEVGDQITFLQQNPVVFPEIRELTELDVHNALIIFGALSQDSDPNARTEYLKGLLHIGASHMDVTFHREAFGNFYRCMESFITKHVLGVKHLSNEVKDIQRALKQLGADEELQSAFTEVYAVRSNQFAHAQKQQVPVVFDDVLKSKTFADLVMYKTYRGQAEEWRAKRDAYPSIERTS